MADFDSLVGECAAFGFVGIRLQVRRCGLRVHKLTPHGNDLALQSELMNAQPAARDLQPDAHKPEGGTLAEKAVGVGHG